MFFFFFNLLLGLFFIALALVHPFLVLMASVSPERPAVAI